MENILEDSRSCHHNGESSQNVLHTDHSSDSEDSIKETVEQNSKLSKILYVYDKPSGEKGENSSDVADPPDSDSKGISENESISGRESVERGSDIKPEAVEMVDIDYRYVKERGERQPRMRTLQCNQCNEHINIQRFKHHVNTAHFERKTNFTCDHCGKGFKFESGLCLHILKHHPVVSPRSGRKTPDIDGHKKGSVSRMGKNGHSCNVCGAEFHTLNHLQAHHKTHCGKKAISCDVCGETFDLWASLRKHMDTHANDIIYNCVICSKSFTCMKLLEMHIGGHTEDCRDCYVCGQQLDDFDDILLHVKGHNDGKMTITEENLARSDSQGGRQDEDNKVTGQGTKEREQVKCTVCSKMFHFVASLQSHMRIHQKDQMLKCHICGEARLGVMALREHIKTHSEAETDNPERSTEQTQEGAAGTVQRKRHRCDICLGRFTSYYSCKSHRLLHIGEKPFRCDICGQRFVLAGGLRLHVLSHIKDKPHVCEICGKSFKQPYLLREHQMSHTGLKPFLCDLCGKKFVNRKKLKLHTFVHTRETPFNCKVCGRGFRSFVTKQKHKCEVPLDQAKTSETNPKTGGTTTSLQTNKTLQMGRQYQLQEVQSSPPSYEDFGFSPISGPVYNLSNQSPQQNPNHMFRYDAGRPVHRCAGDLRGFVMSHGDYMAQTSRYAEVRDVLSTNYPPQTVAWQAGPCNQGVPSNQGSYNHIGAKMIFEAGP